MDKLGQLLSEEKERLDNMQIPDNIEEKLKVALDNRSIKKKKRPYLRTAAILAMVFLLSYNMNTLAFYAKKVIGYDNIMSGTLQDLNNAGRGQVINKTHTFMDGVSVTLDGVMLDANNLVLFYTIEDPYKNVEDASSRMNIGVSGFLDKSMGFGGAGETDSEGVHQKWVVTTSRAPKFYEQTLSLDISYSPEGTGIEKGKIKFKLDRNSAVGNSLTIPINKEVNLKDNNSINIKSMVASPTSTVIKGQIQNILQLGWDEIVGERFSTSDIGMVIYADGIEVPMLGRSISTDMKGMNFEIRFDRLPQKVNTIELKLDSFVSVHEVNELFILEKGKNIEILDQEIVIEDIYEQNGNTFVTLTSEEYTTLPMVSLIIDGVEEKLIRTKPIDMSKIITEETVKTYYTRTLEFEGIGQDLEIYIERFSFNETFDEVIFSYKFEQQQR